MSAATVHHLPTAQAAAVVRDLDEQVRALTPGQWVRITWHHKPSGARGTVEGEVTRPSRLSSTLYVGPSKGVGFCLTLRGWVHPDVTAIETKPAPDLDMDDLAPLVQDWAAASVEYEQKPVGQYRTGDNTVEANALFEAEGRIRTYLRGVRI